MFEVLCLVVMLMMFKKAHKLKTDDNYRDSIINHRSNEINENGELYTGFRRFKSVDGYIKYQYQGLITWGTFAIIYIVITFVEYIFQINPTFKYVVFLIAMIVADHIYYKRNKYV